MGEHVLPSSALHSLTAFGQGTFPRGEGLVPDKSKFDAPAVAGNQDSFVFLSPARIRPIRRPRATAFLSMSASLYSGSTGVSVAPWTVAR